MKRPAGFRYVVAALSVVVALVLYVYGAVVDEAFSPDRQARLAYTERFIKESKETSQSKALADAYWQRYPDVARDKVFGRNGKMGILGAREHYNRHGRQEGRHWGL